jgi:PAS domain S-box-containing protein
LAFPVKVALDSLVDATLPPYLPFAAAVIVAARLGGIGPGLLATLLGAIAGSYFFISPEGYLLKPEPKQNLRLLGFLVVGALLSWLADQLRRISRQAREQKEELRLLVESTQHQATFLLDPEGRVSSWNVGAERVLGYSAKEILGAPLGRFSPRGDASAAQPGPPLGLAATEGRAQGEGWHRRRDGSMFWGSWVLTALRDGARLRGFVAVIRDASEQKRSEEALRESEQRFVRFMQHLPGLAWFKDAAGRYVFANDAAVKTFHTTRAQLYGKTDEELFPPETAILFRENDRRARESGAAILTVETLEHVDGVVHHSIVSKFPIPGPDGAVSVGGMAIDITDRKRAEDALRLSEQRYRAFIRHSSEGIWRFEAERPIPVNLPTEALIDAIYERAYLAECNDAMARMYGYDRAEELVGARLNDLLPRSDSYNLGRIRAFVESGFRLEDTESHEVDRYGDPKYFLNNLVGHIDGGQLLRAWGIQRDITDPKRADEALRQSEERYRLLADSAEDYVGLFDTNGNRLYVSPSFLRLTGFSLEELAATNFRTRVHADDLALVERARDANLRGEHTRIEYRCLRKDGSALWLDLRGTPIIGVDGKVDKILCVGRDITDRRRAEEALRRSEARLSAIVATAADAIITIDQERIIESVNPAAERLFGHTAAEMVGQNVAMLMPSPFCDEHDSYLASYLRTGVKKIMGQGREVQGLRKDGSTFPVDLTVSEVDRQGIFTGILRDVSIRKQLEREVLEAAASEQRRIGQELHDSVGQELTGLGLLAAALAKRVGEVSPAHGAMANRITEGLERVHRQVRSLSRGLVPVPVDAEGLRAALEELAARTGEESQSRCTFACTGPTEVKHADTATHLLRIAQEAVSNALRHGHPRHIHITLHGAADSLILGVEDDGVGMSGAPEIETGLGIRLMHYRAGIIGGSLVIGVAEGGGILVSCLLPGGQTNESE